MPVPAVGKSYRGVNGRTGYLLSQAWRGFLGAMEATLAHHELSPAQYAVLTVLARDPGISGADLARACTITAQAMTGLLATLERDELVERCPHPTHGRILQTSLTRKGRARLAAARPDVDALEAAVESGFSASETRSARRWLVAVAKALGS